MAKNELHNIMKIYETDLNSWSAWKKKMILCNALITFSALMYLFCTHKVFRYINELISENATDLSTWKSITLLRIGIRLDFECK